MGPDKNNAVMNHRHDDKRVKAGKAYGELGPLRNKVYVEPILIKDRQTEAGLFLAAPKLQGAPNTGKVLAIGEGVEHIEVGDTVVFNDKNARGFWLNDVAHIPLEQEQIIAIIGAES